ncbi:MAG: DUF167 domain-containing protein [Parachlamydiaceae bacterium]|nr:MAG: DUF167 domain-containing protein [Parachlamydiaceae bacterium]
MYQESKDGIYLLIKVIPNASKTEIVGVENERLKIRLAAVPKKANIELIRFLAKTFSISKSQITLVQGETSRLKKFLLKN